MDHSLGSVVFVVVVVAPQLEEALGRLENAPSRRVGLGIELSIDPQRGLATIVDRDDVMPAPGLERGATLEVGHPALVLGCEAEVEPVIVAADHKAPLVVAIVLEGANDSRPFFSRAHQNPAFQGQFEGGQRDIAKVVRYDEGVGFDVKRERSEPGG